MRRDALILLAITVLAAALRLYRLDSGLWYDEVLTLVDFVRLPVNEIVTTYTSLNNHVLFTLQAHASVALFGESAWAVRLPAAIFGIATVPLTWLLVRRIGAPMAWAHVTALLVAVNYHHIWFSQNARGYTGLVFWCLAATICFVEGGRRPDWRPWLWFSLAAAAALYTHLSAAFFLIGLALVYLVFAVARRPALPGLASAMPLIALPLTALFVLLAYAPMIPDMIAAFSEVAAPEANTATGEEAMAVWRSPIWTLLEILRSLPLPLPLTLVALPVLLLVFGLGFWRVWRLHPPVALLVPASIAVTFAILTAGGMRLWPRYFIVDLPLLLLFATAGAAGLAALLGRIRLPARGLTVAFWTLGIAASTVWAAKNYTAPKQDFAGAVALVEAESGPGAVRASLGLAATPISAYFAPDWDVLDSPAELDAALSGAAEVWIVWAFDDHTRDTRPEIMERIDRDFDRVARLPGTLGGGSVYVARSRETGT
ncbi:phospholipid carrier-dependent glycosyltransferase [Rhodobacterales bacterium HKCCE2091]|nr:phospholipid carrier-dependent glycosyltransferase [Rhodobacterales bacterium HKCCE2091]